MYISYIELKIVSRRHGGSGGVMSERLYAPLKMLSYAVLVLMFGAIAYAFAISLLYWSGINV